ncbi:MAG TPA: hypothetical protein VJN96_13420 [Vicinamibacterales bacterium]|nr:hypothetical protein [Vicinamibacterales bacterium]
MSETPPAPAPQKNAGGNASPLVELVKALALPLVTLLLGYWFNASLNERQQIDTNTRLYIEMQGRREEADSNLRKDMFNSILQTFVTRDPASRASSEEVIRQQTLSLELLAANFHESLDIAPLFKDVERHIALEERSTNTELRQRLESVALQVIERQLTTMADVGSVERGDAMTSTLKTPDSAAYLMFGARTVPNPAITPGQGTSRLCLTMQADDGSTHYRQFTLELTGLDERHREVVVRLVVTKPVTREQCHQPALDLVAAGEVDTNFSVGLFDFPMIDNTRLSNNQRAAVSLIALTPDVLSLKVAYFPSSRASLKDKPYYEEMTRQLVGGRPQRGDK